MENFGEGTPNAHTLDATVNIKGLSAKFCLSVYPLLSLSIDPSLFFWHQEPNLSCQLLSVRERVWGGIFF